jgi:hypothetical protein
LAGLNHLIAACTLAIERGSFNLPADVEAGDLLESLLASLLADFDHWFSRGHALLEQCPDSVLNPDDRKELAERLVDGQRSIAATRSLLQASSQPMAVSMEAMNPWHGLVTEVWGLAAKLAVDRRHQTLT